MVKRFIQFFIVLFVLLTAGSAGAYAGTAYSTATGITTVKNNSTQLNSNTPGLLKIAQNIVTAHPFVVAQQDKIDTLPESDDETDKSVSLKKCQDFTKYYLSTYCTRAPAYVQQKKLSDLSQYIFPVHYTSVRKYIIFRVIRL